METADEQLATNPPEPPNGMFNGRLDEKGRLKLPVAFAEYLGSLPEKRLFVTSTDRRTAQIYPIATWRENLKRLREERAHKAEAQRILFNSQDFGGDSDLKEQGRVTFNPELRRKLKLDNQGLRLYWNNSHIKILSEELYDAQCAINEATAAHDLEVMEGAGLL